MVPVFNVKAEVDMEILVVVIMEDTVWLPGLPPQRLESDTRVVNDAVIINIEQHEAVHRSIEFHEEHWRDVDGLDVEELHGVDGGDGESGGLFVGVVQLVEVLTSRGKVTEWEVCVDC